jgi:feruloyl esterase
MSAGGAFVAVMLSAYPDRFRAGSVMSGVPYKCATDQTSGSTCASSGVTKTAAQWGDLARSGDPGFSGTWPRMQIWHGSKDYTVATVNAQELVKQWTNVWGTDADADATDMVSGSTRTQYKAGSTVAVELYMVGGMGHAIATGEDALGACPATSGAFFADEKICSTLRAAQFFGLLGDSGDPGGDGSGSGSGDGSGSNDGSGSSGDGGGCNAGGSPGLLVAFALLFSGLSAAGSSRSRRAR